MSTTDAPPSTTTTTTTGNLILFPGPSAFQSHSPPPQPPQSPSQPEPKPSPFSVGLFSVRNRPPLRLTTEFDSDTSVFFNKVSCKLFKGLAKLKLSFNNSSTGEIADPQLSLVTENLSVHYDVEERNAMVKGSVGVGPNLRINAAHDLKARQGEVTLAANLSDPGYKVELATTVPSIGLARQGEVTLSANLSDPGYKVELATTVPSIGLPKATLKFPCGEVSVEEKEDEEVKRILSVSGVVKGSILNGVCTALYRDDNLNLRYSYKDAELSFIPSISLPTNAVSVAFKRRFSPSDKLSYLYNFDSNYWSTVYKRTVGKDYKFKAGYDSEVRLGWASLWAGDEAGKAKAAPMKMKVQFMVQVPQDDIKSSVLMFRVKKRWDI